MKQEIIKKLSKNLSYNLSFKKTKIEDSNIKFYLNFYQDEMKERIEIIHNEILAEIKQALDNKFDVPKNILGWSIISSGGYFRAHKRINGIVKSIHLGKDFNLNEFKKKISKNNAILILYNILSQNNSDELLNFLINKNRIKDVPADCVNHGLWQQIADDTYIYNDYLIGWSLGDSVRSMADLYDVLKENLDNYTQCDCLKWHKLEDSCPNCD